MTFDFLVLGATGSQGLIVSRYLLEKGYKVLMCDKDEEFKYKIKDDYKDNPFEVFDLEDNDELLKVMKKSGAKVLINCAEDEFILSVYKSCLEIGMNCVDLGSFFSITKDQLEMDSDFRNKNLIAITGAGSVPGIGNVMLKYAAKKFGTISKIGVGFAWDSNMKVFVLPFSIDSIIWELTKPAPVLENGKFVEKVPMNNTVVRDFRVIGKQKITPVDHPETYSFYHYFKDKGVKDITFYSGFPDHSFSRILTMIELGLGSEKPLLINGNKVLPIDVLIDTLRRIKDPKGYKEDENLWVDIYGEKDGKEKLTKMECIVHTLDGWEDHGSNVDTGFPAAIMAEMIFKGVIKEKGSFAPEGVVPEKEFFEELRKWDMVVYENGEVIN